MHRLRIVLWLVLVANVGCGAALPAAELGARLASARDVARDASKPEAERLIAIRRLGESGSALVIEPLGAVLRGSTNDTIRVATARALGETGRPEAVRLLLEGWGKHSVVVKQAVFHACTTRPSLASEFLTQLARGVIPLGEVDAATRQRLANFPDEQIAAAAGRLFARQPLLDARATLARFKPALLLKGDVARGKEVFKERTCINCHRIGDEGHFVGADLFTIKDMARDELLQQIVAPNLFFMPTFQAFMAEAADGELIEGVVAGTTETTVTIRQAGGIDRVFSKASLKRLKGLNVSLMPEGLLEGLSMQQVADLLEFIRSLRGF